MTADEVARFLERKDARIAFDTNVVITLRSFFEVVERMRTHPSSRHVEVIVPSAVHFEVLLDLKQAHGDRYDEQRVSDGLRGKQIKVAALTEAHAEHISTLTRRRHPTTPDWHSHKRRRCLECVGLPTTTKTEGNGHACGATIDWLVAGQSQHEAWLLVTNDQGVEFEGVSLRTTGAGLRAALDLLHEPRIA